MISDKVEGACSFFWMIEEVDEGWLPHPCGGEPLQDYPQHMAGVTTGHPGNISGMLLQIIVC